ncbi:MAG TPA: sigma 54-interacting transcriptional regulator [Chthoniobacterales bacterium]|nr:sigma 54-interacting transcriptional regulator [Chthoniobacterales bacterium]
MKVSPTEVDQASTKIEERLVIHTTPALIHTALPDGNIDFFNRRWLEYLGLTLEDVQGWRWTAVIHPEDVAGIVEKWRTSLATGEPFEAETRVRRADGVYRWFLHRKVALRDDCGKIVRWYGSSIDIEDRKQAEDALRRSEAYLAEAQRLSHTGSFGWNTSTGEIFWSEETYRITGFDRSIRPALDLVFQRVHPDDLALVRQTLDRTAQKGTNLDFEHRLLMPDGSTRYVHVIGRPLKNESGCLEFVGSVMDITAAKRSQRELQQALQEIAVLKDQLYKENIALRAEIGEASMFEEIVGGSPLLKGVLARVAKVAPTDSTVLITGETGTGKELIARAIHKRSQRSGRAFVKVSCAAIPHSLIASELFGHEKGAFTGALQRRLGRFELAEGGTILLDEIGELPAEMQIALLRVLQEREFERVGGNQSIRADVRIIAATHRDLPAVIVTGGFRSDLFYRINVFPIEIPPLRERREDIPMLVRYFIDRYARKAGKRIRSVSNKTLELLQSYPWPGNIRELQNVIERSVIVCDTENFSVDESWLSRGPVPTQSVDQALPEKLAIEEKAMIETALAQTRGQVAGAFGAAAKLGMPASTLESKIKTLRISKRRFKSL